MRILAKDFWKEILLDNLGEGNRDWSRLLSDRAYDLLFAVAETRLANGESIIIEGNFRRNTQSGIVRGIISRTHCDVKQYVCGADGDVLVQRCEQRAKSSLRHAGHLDELLLGELRSDLERGWIDPLDLPGELIRVDTGIG